MNKNHRCQCHRNHDKDFTIDPLFFYRSRDGRKIRIYSTNAGGKYPIHGAILFSGDLWAIREWTINGRINKDHQNHGDIVGLWIEKPKIDWSNLPKWATHIAMDKDGDWYWFSGEPESYHDGWFAPDCTESVCGAIPTEYAPDWQGNWENSLILRED